MFNTPASQHCHKVGRQIHSVTILPQQYRCVSCLALFKAKQANLLTRNFIWPVGPVLFSWIYQLLSPAKDYPDNQCEDLFVFCYQWFSWFSISKVSICGRVTVTEWTQRGKLYVLDKYCLFGNWTFRKKYRNLTCAVKNKCPTVRS